jgi:hypothetical protein
MKDALINIKEKYGVAIDIDNIPLMMQKPMSSIKGVIQLPRSS